MTNLDPVLPYDRSNENKIWVVAIYVLYLVGFAVIGLIVAYVKRGTLGSLWEGHLTYAIRTFWIGLVGVVAGAILSLLLVGFVVIWAVGIWALIRVVVGIVRAISDQPIADPETWLI